MVVSEVVPAILEVVLWDPVISTDAVDVGMDEKLIHPEQSIRFEGNDRFGLCRNKVYLSSYLARGARLGKITSW